MKICVWSIDSAGNWSKNPTEHLVGSTDEFLYFRVIRDGTKEFYHSDDDHYYHMTKFAPIRDRLSVWKRNSDNNWSNDKTDLYVNTGDDRDFYCFNNGFANEYYESYQDCINHRRTYNTFYLLAKK